MIEKKDHELALKQILLAFVRSKDFLVDKEMSKEVVDFLAEAYKCQPSYIKDKYVEIYKAHYSDDVLTFAKLAPVCPDKTDSE